MFYVWYTDQLTTRTEEAGGGGEVIQGPNKRSYLLAVVDQHLIEVVKDVQTASAKLLCEHRGSGCRLQSQADGQGTHNRVHIGCTLHIHVVHALCRPLLFTRRVPYRLCHLAFA